MRTSEPTSSAIAEQIIAPNSLKANMRKGGILDEDTIIRRAIVQGSHVISATAAWIAAVIVAIRAVLQPG